MNPPTLADEILDRRLRETNPYGPATLDAMYQVQGDLLRVFLRKLELVLEREVDAGQARRILDGAAVACCPDPAEALRRMAGVDQAIRDLEMKAPVIASHGIAPADLHVPPTAGMGGLAPIGEDTKAAAGASEAEITGSCDEPVWDGPFQMTCGRTLTDGKCGRHGPRNATCRYCGQHVILGKHGWRLQANDSSAYGCADAPRGYHGVDKGGHAS